MLMNSNEYKNLHRKLRNMIQKPEFCEECKVKPPFDLANISNQYLNNTNDWVWLCRTCHMKKDGRLEKLQKYCTPEIIQKAVRVRQEKYKNGELQRLGWVTKKLRGFEPNRRKGRFVKSNYHYLAEPKEREE